MSSSHPQQNTLQQKILIIEDEVVVAMDLQTKLERLGYAVPAIVRYGEQVLTTVEREQPDLVLMDIQLKGEMRGTTAGEQISDNYRIPVIFLTAFSDEESFAEAKQSNPYAFLQKPVSFDNLRLTIDMALYKAGMEKKLQRSEKKYRRLFENSVAGIYQSTPNGRYLSVNRAFAAMVGYTSPAEMLDKMNDIEQQYYVDPENRRTFMRLLEEQGSVENFEFRFHHCDGSVRWLTTSSQLVRDENGRPLYYEGVDIDITQRKQAEVSLQNSHDQLLDILSSISANVYVADLDSYEILFMNQHMIEEMGADLTGKICWQVLRHETEPCANCTSDLLLDAQGCPAESQVREYTLEANDKTYLIHDRAIHWTDGRLVRLQIATDISEIRRLEQQLRQKFKMEAIGVMAGGVAHNFNNSMAVMLSSIELAQLKRNQPEVANDYLEIAKTAIFRSRDLVQQILAYSSQSMQDSAPVLLDALVDDGLRLITVTLPSRIQLQRQTSPPSNPLSIQADFSQLQEVLVSLCNNAVQAMEDTGQLTIATGHSKLTAEEIPAQYDCSPGDYAWVSVVDTGCGMDATTQEQIFDPFFTTRPVDQGTGLGLSTAEGIVKQHRGFITVSSEPGRGSTFTLYFPLLEQLPETAESGNPSADLPRGQGKILYVDDDAMVAALSRQLLEELGYQVTQITSATEALQVFHANPEQFDLVISDQIMPELSGKQLLSEMRRFHPQIGTVLCSGYNEELSEKEKKQFGIDLCLFKPLDLKELDAGIRQVLAPSSSGNPPA